MQPYGNDERDQFKGLFTFYKEQEQIEKVHPFILNKKSLNKILAKEHTNSLIQKKQQIQLRKKLLLPHTERQSHKLQAITQQKYGPFTKRQELKINKSIVEDPTGFKHQEKSKNVKDHVQKIEKTKDPNKQSHISNEHFQKPFSKYLSELDTMKKRKKILVSSNQQKQEKSLSFKRIESPKKIKKSDDNALQNQKSKIQLHFKKLALQPQEFDGLSDLNKNFQPVSIQKRQKSALKSYRKQKLRVIAMQKKKESNEDGQGQKQQGSQKLQKLSIFNRGLEKYQILIQRQNKETQTKLIRVQKLANKPLLNQKSQKCENLPKINKSSPQPKLNENGNCMSLQILKNNELKSKYQIRNIEKQEENILSTNQRLRNEIRLLKSSPQQLRHYISMRYSPDYESQQSPRHHNLSASLSTNHHIQNQKSEQLSFKKQKQIFCRRDQYLKNYSKKLKKNIFSIQKQQEKQIKSVIQQKRKQIISDLMEKLTFK